MAFFNNVFNVYKQDNLFHFQSFLTFIDKKFMEGKVKNLIL